MGKIAFVFSGQGAQHPGMGMYFYEQDPAVRDLFDRAEAIRPGTLETMRNGDEETLRATENTQPCLYLADLAPAMVLDRMGVHPDGVAGFSLGELPALSFAGACELTEGFALTVKRGLFMGEASRAVHTAMAAVVKLPNQIVEQACRDFTRVYPVNYNCPGQLVVAGDAEEMPAFSQRIRELGGMALPLKVAGGFHSPFMESAAVRFAQVLSETDFATPRIPVYANRTGLPYEEPVAKTLSEQMNHPVLWEKTIRQMSADGFDTFVETGVGNVLSKLIAKILPGTKVYTVSEPEACEKVAGEVSSHA